MAAIRKNRLPEWIKRDAGKDSVNIEIKRENGKVLCIRIPNKGYIIKIYILF